MYIYIYVYNYILYCNSCIHYSSKTKLSFSTCFSFHHRVLSGMSQHDCIKKRLLQDKDIKMVVQENSQQHYHTGLYTEKSQQNMAFIWHR